MSGAFIRFLHTADWRLDLPIFGLDEVPQHLRELLVDAPYDAARRVVDAALKERVDFVLLAGNIVDPRRCGPRGIAFLLEQFQRLAEQDITVYWVGAEHDLADRWPDAAKLPSNVQVYAPGKLEELSHFRGDSVIATIIGYAHSPERAVRPGDFNPDSSGQFTIGVTSGDFHADQLAAEELHYWALGGRNNRDTLFTTPHCGQYAGSPQGRDAHDVGPHGCFLVHVDPEHRIRTQFIPTDGIRWHVENLPLSSEVPRHTLQEMLRERMKKVLLEGADRHTLVTWRLEGLARSRGVRYEHLEAELAALLRHEYGYGTPPVWTAAVEITPPAHLPAPWYEEDTLLGDFLRLMRDVEEDSAQAVPIESLLLGSVAKEAATLVRLDDEHQRKRVLRDAALLGVDLLRSGEMPFDPAGLAGGSLSKEALK